MSKVGYCPDVLMFTKHTFKTKSSFMFFVNTDIYTLFQVTVYCYLGVSKFGIKVDITVEFSPHANWGYNSPLLLTQVLR